MGLNFHMDALHCALLAVVVLLAVYGFGSFGGGVEGLNVDVPAMPSQGPAQQRAAAAAKRREGSGRIDYPGRLGMPKGWGEPMGWGRPRPTAKL